jgi:hypothetical protein
MIDTLPDEEWFTQLRNWRDSEFGKASSWHLVVTADKPYPHFPSYVPTEIRRPNAPLRRLVRAESRTKSFPMSDTPPEIDLRNGGAVGDLTGAPAP